jgi:hypothetical protein
VGDTTYAVSYADGTYQFTRDTKPSGISTSGLGYTGQISLYPNPVADILHINTAISIVQEVQIIDAMGRIVWYKKDFDSANTIHISCLPPGIYTLILKEHSKVIVAKFVKE